MIKDDYDLFLDELLQQPIYEAPYDDSAATAALNRQELARVSGGASAQPTYPGYRAPATDYYDRTGVAAGAAGRPMNFNRGAPPAQTGGGGGNYGGGAPAGSAGGRRPPALARHAAAPAPATGGGGIPDIGGDRLDKIGNPFSSPATAAPNALSYGRGGEHSSNGEPNALSYGRGGEHSSNGAASPGEEVTPPGGVAGNAIGNVWRNSNIGAASKPNAEVTPPGGVAGNAIGNVWRNSMLAKGLGMGGSPAPTPAASAPTPAATVRAGITTPSEVTVASAPTSNLTGAGGVLNRNPAPPPAAAPTPTPAAPTPALPTGATGNMASGLTKPSGTVSSGTPTPVNSSMTWQDYNLLYEAEQRAKR